jgi:hypothetical protein
MRSTLLTAAAAAALTVMALPVLAQAQSVAAKNPCEITDPVAHGAAKAQAQADIIADHPSCAQAPLTPSANATDTSAVSADTSASYSSATTTAEASPPVVSTTSYQPQAPTVTNQLVTNGPVADTPENRARYGQPMSRAGKMTKPVGN